MSNSSFCVTVFSTKEQFLWAKTVCENFDNLQNIENDITTLFDSFTNLLGDYGKLIKYVDTHLKLAKNQINNNMTAHQKNVVYGKHKLFEKAKEGVYLYEKLEANFNELQKVGVFLKNANTQFCDPRYIFAYLGIAPTIYNDSVFNDTMTVSLRFIGQERDHNIDYPSHIMVNTCAHLRGEYLQKLSNLSLPDNQHDKFDEISKLYLSE